MSAFTCRAIRFSGIRPPRALEIFNAERLTESRHRNGILIFLNLRTKRFAILADEGVHRKQKQKYWDELSLQFQEDLLSTHHENAVVILLFTLLERLRKLYPAEAR